MSGCVRDQSAYSLSCEEERQSSDFAISLQDKEARPTTPTLYEAGPRRKAYEMKFLISQEQSEQVQMWAKQRMALDRYAEPALNDVYRIRSVYFDTERLDVYHRAPKFRRRKFRLRRYREDHQVFLECKLKTGDRVSKRRAAVHEHEISCLQLPLGETSWVGQWFHQRLILQRLAPRMLISYNRTAYVSAGGSGPLRLTLDRNIECAPAAGYCFEPGGTWLPLLTGETILELKFCAAMPAIFKHLIQEIRLNQTAVSKYRRAVDAWGCAEIRRGIR